MITLRHRDNRGSSNAGWLQSQHTFSFANYFDPDHMGFGPLRVINEDKVEPAAGFGAHSHSNMEIVSYVLAGALEHKDSMGNSSVIRPGDIQRMSAGTGVTHSEYNHSGEVPVHFLQIWFLPDRQNVEPSYAQKFVDASGTQDALKLVLSRDGREGSVDINQDIDMYVGRFDQEDSAEFEPSNDRLQWVQIVRGQVYINGSVYQQGDGLAVKNERRIQFSQGVEAEVLLFDMKQ